MKHGRARTDHGFTIVELTISMAIATTVMASIFGILISQSNAERRMSAFADNQEVLRQAVIAMQRDIRSSEPLERLPENQGFTARDYALRIDLKIYEDILSPTPVGVRWRVDDASDQLLRELTDANGAALAVTHRVTGVKNDYGNPLFTFYKADLAATKYNLVDDRIEDIARCTVRIEVRLVAAPTPGPEPAILISDAQLRNRLPGGIGCT